SASYATASPFLRPASRRLEVEEGARGERMDKFAGHPVIPCLSWMSSLRARISVLARVPAEWSPSPSSLFRC
uniref:Uncharacterized protein n=1 Tax=Triticum urartu TaxID=4572 RepID=A0A8R7UFW1_TRIUA